jgi:MFS family permease
MFTRQGIYQTVLQLYLNQILGLSITDIGWVVSMRVAGMVLFLFLAGSLSDRYGRKIVLIIGYLISGIALYFFSRVDNLFLLLFSGFLAGVGDAFSMTTLLALLSDIAPSTARGVVVGLYRTFQDIGGFLGPIVYMLVFSSFNSSTTFYIGILLFFINILMVSKVK